MSAPGPPPVAMVGVLVLAPVAGGLNVFGEPDAGGEIAADVGQGRPISMGYIDWPEGVASAYLWKETLQQRGFTPETKSLEVGALCNGQAQGSVDIQTNSWLPATHASYWAKYQDRLEDYGCWYDETSLEIAVPSYVKGVKSLDDLKGKGDLFRGRIYGTEPGAGETKLYEEKVQNVYGLDGEYELVKSNTSAMPAQLDRAHPEEGPSRSRSGRRTGRTTGTTSPGSPTPRRPGAPRTRSARRPPRASPGGTPSRTAGWRTGT